MKKIVLTGGGTAGHVTPNLALAPRLTAMGYAIHYIGSINGMEKGLVEKAELPYTGISSGKLRRYLDIKNVTDAFRIVKGIGDALKVLGEIKPDVIFSKGGFVTVPVVIAGWILKIPVVIHESDMTPGLANKLAAPFAKKICVSFPETLVHVGGKGVLTGAPIRQQLFAGNREKGSKICGFDNKKPVVLVMGGSLGSAKLNGALRECLPDLLKQANIVHLCGEGNVDETYGQKGYKQFAYVNEDLSHLFALADVMVSRAGANAIFEFLALKKPALLIPLSKAASRGDQILNAQSFAKLGFAAVLYEEDLTPDTFKTELRKLLSGKEAYIRTMENSGVKNGVDEVLQVIQAVCVKQ